MQDDEIRTPTPDERIAHQAKVWRRIEKAAIANKCDAAKQRAEHQERKKLREVVDLLGQVAGAG